jgi:hypothetical protein
VWLIKLLQFKKKQQERKKDPGEESQETELGEETER